MGVAYHAHARFLDRHGNKITVPAPVDPQTSGVPWWYDWIAMNAGALRRAGFTAILYPPVCKTQSGHFNTGDGYGVFDQYDIGSKNQMGAVETRFGSREHLQRSIAIAHACGLDVYIDTVMHQLIGGNNGVYRYLGAHGVPNIGRFPKDPGCFRGNPPRRPQDPVPVPRDDFSFGDEFVYVHCEPPGYTAHNMIDFGDWLTLSLDCDGYRVDDVKGTAVAFIKDWMNAKAMAGKFCVSEYFDGNPQSLFGWAQHAMGGRSAVFDFTTHFGLQRMCDDPGFDMRQLDGLGYTALDPFHSATFVENPDTDLSPGENISNNKLLAYAFILTTEGYPFIFHKDYSTEPGCYGLKRWIDNLVWIHENLAFGATVTRHADAQTFVYERQGHPGLLTAISKDPFNRRTITCSTSFGANVLLHDYTGRHPDIQTDSTGHATFTASSNGFSSGQSYLCFSRAGIGGSPPQMHRSTTQTFFWSPGSGYCSNTERRGDHRASLGSTGHTDHCPVTGAARPVACGRVGRVRTLRRERPGAGLGEARLCRNCRVPSNRAADWVANLQIHSSRFAGGQRCAVCADCDIHLHPGAFTGTWGLSR